MLGQIRRLSGSVVVAALLAAGIGVSVQARGDEPAADPAIVKLVPTAVRATGALVIGTDATYPPFESTDPKTNEIIGFDVDVGRGIAALMGLQVKFVNTPFDNLIPSLASGKLSVAMSSIGDTKEREGVVDFVTYYWNSTNLLVSAANPKKLAMDHLCGAKVGVERGTLQQTTMLPELIAKCPNNNTALAAGSIFNNNTNAVLALSSGRIDTVLNDAVENDHVAETSDGQFVTVGPLMRNKSPGGVAIAKDSGLQPAILASVKKLMQDGAYAAALKSWRLVAIGIDNPTIDWAGQQK